MGFRFGIGKKEEEVVSTMAIDRLFIDNKYSLLETISILKYKANKDSDINSVEVINMINQLRLLTDKFSVTTKQTAKDTCMQLSFELGKFCNEFENLCTKLGLINPLNELSLQDVCKELTILKKIDEDYFSKVEFEVYTEDNFKEENYDFKMYDTLFYLHNHCIVGYTSSDVDLAKVFDDIDKNIANLKEFISNRKSSNSNEDVAFHMGTLIEALATIAYDYDIPNELNITFDTGFVTVLNKLDLALQQIDRFKDTKIESITPITTGYELENDIALESVK